jgi:hypothetical protein
MRNLSFLGFSQMPVPRFARNDVPNHFFRKLFNRVERSSYNLGFSP